MAATDRWSQGNGGRQATDGSPGTPDVQRIPTGVSYRCTPKRSACTHAERPLRAVHARGAASGNAAPRCVRSRREANLSRPSDSSSNPEAQARDMRNVSECRTYPAEATCVVSRCDSTTKGRSLTESECRAGHRKVPRVKMHTTRTPPARTRMPWAVAESKKQILMCRKTS